MYPQRYGPRSRSMQSSELAVMRAWQNDVWSCLGYFSVWLICNLMAQVASAHVMLLRFIEDMHGDDMIDAFVFVVMTLFAILGVRCFLVARLWLIAEFHKLPLDIVTPFFRRLEEVQFVFSGGQIVIMSLITLIVLLDYPPFGNIIIYIVLYVAALIALHLTLFILALSVLWPHVQGS